MVKLFCRCKNKNIFFLYGKPTFLMHQMASSSISSPCTWTLLSSFPFSSPKFTFNPQPKPLNAFPSTKFSCSFPIAFSFPSHKASLTTEPEPEPRDDDTRTALDTVLKLYRAIKNKNLYEVYEVISEECSCICRFGPLRGKEQVVAFFAHVIDKLGNNLQLVVQRTLDDGMVVGVTWRLEWNNIPLFLGQGFSLNMCHLYEGKVMIRHVEVFLEPLLQLEQLRLEGISAIKDLSFERLLMDKKARERMIFYFRLIVALVTLLTASRRK